MKKKILLITIFFMIKTSGIFSQDTVKILEEANVFDEGEIKAVLVTAEKNYQSQKSFSGALKITVLKHNLLFALNEKNLEVYENMRDEKNIQIAANPEMEKQAEETAKLIKNFYLEYKNPLFLAYLGSVEIIQAGIMSEVSLKSIWVKKGLRHLDEGVEKAGGNEKLFLKILRGIGSSYLPPFFNRFSSALRDLEEVYQKAYPARLEVFQNDRGAVLLFHLGKLYEQNGQSEKAKEFYRECAKKFPETKYAKKALKKIL